MRFLEFRGRVLNANWAQMFSILNELSDDSPGGVITVVGSSIGSAASIYILVAITGYLTFGNEVAGNIVSMCKTPTFYV